jgi:hypothetical protein
MAIIGGYAARNAQNIAAIQANAAQLGEGNANIAFELGRLHLVEPINSSEEMSNHIMSKGIIIKIININHRRRTRRFRNFSSLFFSL